MVSRFAFETPAEDRAFWCWVAGPVLEGCFGQVQAFWLRCLCSIGEIYDQNAWNGTNTSKRDYACGCPDAQAGIT